MKPKSFITEIQANGQRAERTLIHQETYNQAKRLADKTPAYPPDRLMYVRNLTLKTLRKEIDLEVFKMFVKITNSWLELETCAPRAKQIVGRR